MPPVMMMTPTVYCVTHLVVHIVPHIALPLLIFDLLLTCTW